MGLCVLKCSCVLHFKPGHDILPGIEPCPRVFSNMFIRLPPRQLFGWNRERHAGFQGVWLWLVMRRVLKQVSTRRPASRLEIRLSPWDMLPKLKDGCGRLRHIMVQKYLVLRSTSDSYSRTRHDKDDVLGTGAG